MKHGGTDQQLSGRRVAITGRLASMTHREVGELIAELGGTVVQMPTRNTQFVVVGQEGLPLGNDGAPTACLVRARQLKAIGYPIEIVNEEAFLSQLGLVNHESQVHRRYTIVQLSRILGVPRDRIRAWMRAGFIEPVETVHRLAYFDYQQVTAAKMLYELVSTGLTPSKLREGLERLRRWLPGIDSPLSQLSVLESSGRLLVRLDDGRLAEPSGQLQLDFEARIDDDEALPVEAREKTTETWFEEAVYHEDAGRFDEAAAAYEAAALSEPNDPIIQFNLGNVYYACGDVDRAAMHFQRAVENDATYVEAWNNLGTLLSELNRTEEAIEALERALEIVPHYADAHFNLAGALATAGRVTDACHHWRAYLQIDPSSLWADEARKKLVDAEWLSNTT